MHVRTRSCGWLLGLFALGSCTTRTPADDDAASAPSTVQNAPEAYTDCTRCHALETSEWRDSAHRTAFTNDVFQGEWSPAPYPACVRCHAPSADPEWPRGAEAEEGVACVHCHGRPDALVSARVSGRAPHATRADTTLASGEACTGCHEFTYRRAGAPTHDPDALLQRTATEWRDTPGAGSCVGCHLPRAADGHRSHRLEGPRSPPFLRRALSIQADARRSPRGTEVRLALSTEDVAHAVPTGDVYRQLIVRAWVPGRARSERTRSLMRHFALRGGRRVESIDDRVMPGAPRVVELTLPRAERVAWRVEWWALDPDSAEARALERDAVMQVVDEGTVEVSR